MENPYIFPIKGQDYGLGQTGITLWDLLFALAPNPAEDYIRTETQYDHNRNPHNDGPPKPSLRSREEIILDYKADYADKALKVRFNRVP